LADYIGSHKITWATDYPQSDGFFPGAPQMIGMRRKPLYSEAKNQVLAEGSDGVLWAALTAGLSGAAKRLSTPPLSALSILRSHGPVSTPQPPLIVADKIDRLCP
jgi:hypothetical protein